MPRVIQRSYRVKSSKVLNGPSPKLPRSRGARRDSPNGASASVAPQTKSCGASARPPRPATTPPAGVGARGVVRVLPRLLLAFHTIRVFVFGDEHPGALRRGPLARHAMDAVARPCAREVRVTPRRARC